MAMDGRIDGARGGSGTGPWMSIYWAIQEQDVANNRSKVKLWFQLYADYNLNFSANKTGTLQGTSFTYTGGFSGTGYRDVRVQEIWVNHDSDGTKTVNFSGVFNIGITWGGNTVNSISASGNATLNPIARTSPATMSSTDFNMGTNVTIYTNKLANYTHQLIYKFGTLEVEIASGVVDSYVWSVPLSLANQIPNATAGIGSIVCHTYNSSSQYIGSKVINFTARVPSNIVPTVSNFSIDISGTGRDWQIGQYIQNMSKVYASFSSAGVYGSTITTRRITIRRRSDGGNSQVINGSSGTTPNVLSLSGGYEAIVDVWDSRGRYNGTSIWFDVVAYSAPRIYRFTANRTTPTTTVNNSYWVNWDTLGGSNTASIEITGKNNAGTTVTLYTLNGSSAGNINTSRNYSSQSDASSYLYTITITDSFGNKATATAMVGTSFVELTIAKGLGVGIGKVHERGSLDVNGDAYVEGDIIATNGTVDFRIEPISQSYIELQSSADIIDFMTPVRFYTGNVTVRNNIDVQGNFSRQPTTNTSETGFCGVGSISPLTWSGSAVAGQGVNFKMKKNYTPSSVSLDGTSQSVDPWTVNITSQGFWLYLQSTGTQNAYCYWRGYYTC